MAIYRSGSAQNFLTLKNVYSLVYAAILRSFPGRNFTKINKRFSGRSRSCISGIKHSANETLRSRGQSDQSSINCAIRHINHIVTNTQKCGMSNFVENKFTCLLFEKLNDNNKYFLLQRKLYENRNKQQFSLFCRFFFNF